jgi:hypothetical protein
MNVRLDRETASALAIAQWLETRPEVARVLCPMLPGSPGHDLWTRDFTGGCGLFSFVLRGGTSAARDALIDALALFGIGYSWGGFESLSTPVDPASIRTASAWPPPGMDAADRFGACRSGWKTPATLSPTWKPGWRPGRRRCDAYSAMLAAVMSDPAVHGQVSTAGPSSAAMRARSWTCSTITASTSGTITSRCSTPWRRWCWWSWRCSMIARAGQPDRAASVLA